MAPKPWLGACRPAGVSEDVGDYHKPLFSILEDSVRDYPDAEFTIFQGASRTYRQVGEATDRLANFLASRGIAKGDRCAVFLPNIPHFPEAYYGILKAGAVTVTCNPLYTAAELNYQLKDCGAKAVFVMDHPAFYPLACQAIQGTDVEVVVVCNIKSYLPKVKAFLGGLLGKLPKAEGIQSGHFMWDDALASAKPQPPNVDIDPQKDLGLIIYTGGTTGVPKGAALTHASLLHNVKASYEWVRLPPSEGAALEPIRKGGAHTFIGVLPWYHSFGMTLCLNQTVISGNRVVCIPDPRAGKPPFTEVLASIEKYKVTILTAVPTIYSAFITHPLTDKFDLTSIQGCGSGGAPIPVEVIKQFEQKTGAVIFEGYGLSETGPVVCINPTTKETRRIGSVGQPVPGTEVAILDLDTGLEEQPLGADAEIAVHGPQVMQGYWNRPDADDEVFRIIDGKRYFLTGDIGHLDADGYLFITDRKKDLILVGGFNAYPREIEETLYEHPKVANAAVVGIPDPKSGEAVKAFIQLKPDQEATGQEIKDFCAERLAGYKRPRYVEFREELPTSVVGKVLRRVLRDEELAKLKGAA